jgi:excisionase family DNA binding protein
VTARLTLSVAETAEALGIGRNRAYDLVSAGVIPSVRLGRSIRVPIQTLEAWLQKEATGSRKQ